MVEVRPDLPAPNARPDPPAIPKGQEKLTPDLRELLGDAAKAGAPTRLEVILTQDRFDEAFDQAEKAITRFESSVRLWRYRFFLSGILARPLKGTNHVEARLSVRTYR